MLCYLAMIETEEERSKFEKIYIQYRRLMYSVAFRVLNNSEDAEDAVHTAFIRIAKKAYSIETQHSDSVTAFSRKAAQSIQ